MTEPKNTSSSRGCLLYLFFNYCIVVIFDFGEGVPTRQLDTAASRAIRKRDEVEFVLLGLRAAQSVPVSSTSRENGGSVEIHTNSPFSVAKLRLPPDIYVCQGEGGKMRNTSKKPKREHNTKQDT